MSRSRFSRNLHTDQYKKMTYPVRPLFTLAQALFFIGLGAIGLVSMPTAIWLSVVFAVDDLMIFPFLQVFKAIDNLRARRKKTTKSILTLVTTTVALVLGAILGVMVLSHLPIMASVLGMLHTSMGTSIVVSAAMMLGGAIFARATNYISPLLGIALGAALSGFVPLTVPFLVESACLGAIGAAFMTSVVTKQALRLYHKLRYGHSNADGYEFNRNMGPDVTAVDHQQAQILDMRPEQVRDLRVACLSAIDAIKKDAPVLNELMGWRTPLSNSFKDIFHLLTQAKTEDDKIRLRGLLIKIKPHNLSLSLEERMSVMTPPSDCKTDAAREGVYHAQIRTAFYSLQNSKNAQHKALPSILADAAAPFISR